MGQHASEVYQRKKDGHNSNVRKYLKVLSTIVECVLFCGKFETPLRGHDESVGSVNPGAFRGLIDFASKLDSALKTHIDKRAIKYSKFPSSTYTNIVLL